MATEGPPLGRIEVDGRLVSARLQALETAVKQGADATAEFTIEDGINAAFGETSGGRRKMRGGAMEQTKEAIDTLKQTVLDQQGRFKTGFDSFIASTLLAIPNLVSDWGSTVTKGALIGTVAKYPTIFAKMTAGVIKMLPVPTGASWSQYGKAVSIIAEAIGVPVAKITSEAFGGPFLATVIALYFQNQRAKTQQISLSQLFVNDAKAVLSVGASGATTLNEIAQTELQSFKTAFETQRRKLGSEDLKELAQLLNQGRTQDIKITAARLDAETGVLLDIPDRFPKDLGEPIRNLAGVLSVNAPEGTKARKAQPIVSKPKPPTDEFGEPIPQNKGPKATATTTKGQTSMRQYLIKQKAVTSSSAPPTTSSSMEDAQMNGGRRRKTRKPKKVRRVTRRRRAIVY